MKVVYTVEIDLSDTGRHQIDGMTGDVRKARLERLVEKALVGDYFDSATATLTEG